MPRRFPRTRTRTRARHRRRTRAYRTREADAYASGPARCGQGRSTAGAIGRWRQLTVTCEMSQRLVSLDQVDCIG